MKRRTKKLFWTGLVFCLAASVGVTLWWHRFHNYTPVEVTRDLRAAIGAKDAPRPVERFLELRYGPLTESANRERAFMDFFNPGHIEGLHIIVRHTPEGMKQSNVDGMAQWLAEYRRTMSAEEKDSLGAFFRSGTGQATLQQATAKYLAQDVHYRALTAPVITELMTTVAAVQKP